MGQDNNKFDARDGSIRIGPVLEKVRRERGLSYEDVEEDTKIRQRYLEALERDDYGALPGGVYARGFLKTYADYLGLDGESLARELKERGPASFRPPAFENAVGPRGYQEEPEPVPYNRRLVRAGQSGRRRVSTAAVAGSALALLLAVLAVGGLYYVGQRVIQASGSAPVSSQDAPTEAPAGSRSGGGNAGDDGEAVPEQEPGAKTGRETVTTEEAERTAAPPEEIRMVVKVEDNVSWLNVRTDGNVAYEQVAQPGFSKTFEAEEVISVWSGNAGAVQIEINGQSYGPLGASGEVKSRDFTLKAAES